MFNCFLAVTIVCENAKNVNPLHLDERGCDVYKIYDAIRRERGLSESYVAEKTGIAKSTFWRWKHGKLIPKVEKLEKIAEVLEVPVSALFKETSDDNST